MNNTETIILNTLLDKYERSIAYREGKEPGRRIMLKLYEGKGKTDFPFYDITDHDRRLAVNRAIESLAESNIVSFRWLKGDTGHIIAQVWLHYDSLDQAYELVKRQPKDRAVDEILVQAEKILSSLTSAWAKEYFQDILALAKRKRDLGGAVPQDDQERTDLWKTIQFVDSHHDLALVERVLSMQLFADSKRFEKTIRSRFLGILRKYLDPNHLCEDDESLLRQVGVGKYPEYFDFCGPLSLANNLGIIDFRPLNHGLSISLADITGAELKIFPHVKRILSIENRANYLEYIAKSKADKELVIYHGGQYSPAKKKFFIAIRNAMPADCIWEHWGDIDLGGFTMLLRLRREINPKVSAYRMSESELISYDKYTSTITDDYAAKLKKLTKTTELADCQACLDYMVASKKRLEQEAMLALVERNSES